MTTENAADLDLVLERTVDISPDLVWTAWSQPEHLKQWWTPKPWETAEVELDLRPGGTFSTVMRAPDGALHPNVGCYLEIVPGKKIVWTDALEAGYRPTTAPAHLGFRFTATITFEAAGSGTRYRAVVQHATAEGKAKHEAMGFHEGWGAVLDQLVAYMKAR